MANGQRTVDQVAPSLKSLAIGSAISAAAAIIVFVAFIMPAEFQRDPLGIGAVLGIKGLSSSDQGSGQGMEAQQSSVKEAAPRTESFRVFLAPGAGIEFKLLVDAGEPILYSWEIDGEPVTFDLHGQPLDGPDGYFESYAVGEASTGGSGWFVTPFEGTHGWYLHNTNKTLSVFRATVTGYFEEAD